MSNLVRSLHQSVLGYGIAAAGLILIIFAVAGGSNDFAKEQKASVRQVVQHPSTEGEVLNTGGPSLVTAATVATWEGIFADTFSGTAADDGSWMEVTRKLTVGRSAIDFEQRSRAGAANPAVGTLIAAIRCRNPIVELSASTVSAGISARCYLSIAARASVQLWSDSVALEPRNGFSRFEFDGSSQTWRTLDGEGSAIILRPTR